MTTLTRQPDAPDNAPDNAAPTVHAVPPPDPPTDRGDVPVSGLGVNDLAEIIRAYNQVTDRLQHSHEVLQAEVVRLRKELASADAQLQRSKRLSALGEMAAGIAHEVRNPLAAIKLYASLIVQDIDGLGPDLAEPLRCAREIGSAVTGLDGIVGDVLSFARELTPKPVPLPVSEVFDRVLGAHQPAIASANVTVVRRDRDAGGRVVHADAELLHRALLNLVRNAVDAMAQTPGPRELTLDARADDAGLTLRVADTGPGIETDAVDRLFNPFFTTRATGTGLGLAIVHRIIDAHGGTIAVTDNPAGGAVFEMCLPGVRRPTIGETHFGGEDRLTQSSLTAGLRSEMT
jgi:signal transduction histidine kinase